MANGPTDPLAVELQRWLPSCGPYQRLCLRYAIGSIAIFGRVDEHGLNIIHRSCSRVTVLYLSDLSNRLLQGNDVGTVAAFAALYIWSEEFASFFGKLMKEDWSVMEGLATKALGILKSSAMMRIEYHLMLKHLPVEELYRMIGADEISVRMVEAVYHDTEEDNLPLREMFLLARCSRIPNPRIRRCIADEFPSFKQCLADDDAGSRIKGPCPDGIVALTDDALHSVSKFMDIETLVYVMPLVCRTWRSLYWRIVMEDTRIHDLYLLDLSYNAREDIGTIVPWKWYLRGAINELEYLGRCIEDGGLGRIKPTHRLVLGVAKYLKAVTEGIIPLLRVEDCGTQYDAFTRLFERIYESCCRYGEIDLHKPTFFTDQEYERAVYHFVYEKRWALRLPDLPVADNMPRLFSIIKEDEDLMRQLVRRNFFNYREASLALILCGQTKKIPDKLARLIFGQSDWFKGLVEPRIVPWDEYYKHMVEFDVLQRAVMDYHYGGFVIPRLLVSLVMTFKDKAEMIDRIETSIAGGLVREHDSTRKDIKRCFGEVSFESLMAAERYSKEDMAFFRGVMMRCGLL